MQHVIESEYTDRHTLARTVIAGARAALADPAVRADPKVVSGYVEAVTRAEDTLSKPNWTLAALVDGPASTKVRVVGPGTTYEQIATVLARIASEAVRGTPDLDEYHDAILMTVATSLGLPPILADRVAAAIAANTSPYMSAPFTDKTDQILQGPVIKRIVLGQPERNLAGETIYQFVDVYGDADYGFLAALTEYYMPRDEPHQLQFVEMRLRGAERLTAGEAIDNLFARLGPVVPQPVIEMNNTRYWVTLETQEAVDHMLALAAEYHGKTPTEVMDRLVRGGEVHYQNNVAARLRVKPAPGQ